MENPDEEDYKRALAAALAWAAEEPGAALRAVEADMLRWTRAGTAAEAGESMWIVWHVGDAAAAVDSAAAAEWLLAAVERGGLAYGFDPGLVVFFAERIVYHLGRDDPGTAWSVVDQLPAAGRGRLLGRAIQGVADADPHAAMASFAELRRVDQVSVLNHLGGRLAAHEGMFAAWWETLDRPMQRRVGVLHNAYEKQPAEVRALIERIDDPSFQHRAVRQALAEQGLAWELFGDPDTAQALWRWVTNLQSVPPEESALSRLFAVWRYRDPDPANEPVSRLTAEGLRAHLLAQ